LSCFVIEVLAQVQGVVEDKMGKTRATLCGKWDENLHYVISDKSDKEKWSKGSSKPCLLWKRNKPPMHPTKYNLTEFAIALNEITPELKVSGFFLNSSYLSPSQNPILERTENTKSSGYFSVLTIELINRTSCHRRIRG